MWRPDPEYVDLGGGPFDQAKDTDERPGEAQTADRKILRGPKGLDPVVGLGGDFFLPQAVAFDAGFRLHSAPILLQVCQKDNGDKIKM